MSAAAQLIQDEDRGDLFDLLKHYRTLAKAANAQENPLCEKLLSSHTEIEIISFRRDNMVCADCSTPEPRWASTNIGCFVCIKCSGIHRSLGSHISKMLSISIDDWTEEDVQKMRENGNAVVNQTYEHQIPPFYNKPNPESTMSERRKFITSKYVRRRFCEGAEDDGQDHLFDRNSENVEDRGAKDNTAMTEYLGLLSIHLKKGNNLLACDINGKSDPFVVFKLGKQKLRSKIIKKTLNPVWNEKFLLCIESMKEEIKLKVMDYDIGSRNDKMGHATVSLQGLEDAKPKAITVPLEGVGKGELELELTFTSLT